jgi:hypothetical protein
MLHHRTIRDRDRSKPSATNNASVKREEVQIEDDGVSRDGMVGKEAAERIEELTRALAVAKEEQNAMREELAKLHEHGAVYRETIGEYRRQLTGTYDYPQSLPGAFHPHSRPTSSDSITAPLEYGQQTKFRRSSHNHHRDDLSEQNRDPRPKVAQLQAQISPQEALFQSRIDPMQFRSEADWNDLTSRLHTTEKESQERLQQLLSLKSSISSLTRMDVQVTDSELSEGLSKLANRVRDWVISNFRRANFDLSIVPLETAKALGAISPNYTNISRSNRLALYQALVSSTMMHIFLEPIVLGLPETGPLASMRQLAAFIHDIGTEYHEWRRTTIRTLENSRAKQLLQKGREKLMHRLCSEIEHQLFTLTSVNLTSNAQATLEGILYAAADFQNTLLLQKAQYKVIFFRNQEGLEVEFDDCRMESINDLDDSIGDDMVIDRKIAFCVFPCLEKIGDEYGEHVDIRNILLKASVCCGDG